MVGYNEFDVIRHTRNYVCARGQNCRLPVVIYSGIDSVVLAKKLLIRCRTCAWNCRMDICNQHGNIRIRNQREVLIRLRTVSRTEQKRESIGILTLRIVVIFFRSEDVIKTNLARERGKIEFERGRVDRTRNSERL